MIEVMTKIAFSFVSLLHFVSLAAADTATVYTLKNQDSKELRRYLEEFNQLTHVQANRGTTPNLGGIFIRGDLCCTHEFEDQKQGLKIKDSIGDSTTLVGRVINFTELSQLHTEYERNLDSEHKFYKSGDYLLDIETLSLVHSEDEGSSYKVVFRIKHPNGVQVIKGIKSCWC